MRLIDRYILREFLLFFAIAFAVATFVLFLDKLLWLTTLALRSRLPWTTVLRFFGYLLPTVSGLTLPIAFLIGCTLAFNRLSTDSEYLVLKATGVSFYRLLLPLLAIAAIMYVCCSAILMYVSPWGMQGLRQLLFEVARSRAHYHLEAGQFHDAFQGLMVYVQRTYPEARRLEGIFIADTRAEPGQVITARTGEILIQEDALKVILRLQQGRLHRYAAAGKRYHLLRFERYDVQLNLDTQLTEQATRQRQARELYPAQLRGEIAQRQASGEEVRSFLIFQQQRYTLPFACILFAVLGPGLGVVRTRSGRSGGYLLGIGAIFLYYIFSTAGDALGEETRLPPLLAAWLPNLVMISLIPWLVHRANRDAAMIDLAGIWLWMGRQFRRWLPTPPRLK